jgi:hypothetical protein
MESLSVFLYLVYPKKAMCILMVLARLCQGEFRGGYVSGEGLVGPLT